MEKTQTLNNLKPLIVLSLWLFKPLSNLTYCSISGAGRYDYQTKAMIGRIDNFGIWATYLTPQEIKTLNDTYFAQR